MSTVRQLTIRICQHFIPVVGLLAPLWVNCLSANASHIISEGRLREITWENPNSLNPSGRPRSFLYYPTRLPPDWQTPTEVGSPSETDRINIPRTIGEKTQSAWHKIAMAGRHLSVSAKPYSIASSELLWSGVLYSHAFYDRVAYPNNHQSSPTTGEITSESLVTQLQTSETSRRFKEANKANEKGLELADKGKPQEALEYLNKALIIFRQIKAKPAEISVLSSIGTVYADIGLTQEALRKYNDALALAKDSNYKYETVTILSNIASTYGNTGHSEKALEYLEKARAQAQEPFMVVNVLNSMAQVYEQLGQIEKAIEYQQRSLQTYRDFRNVILEHQRGIETAILSNLGLFHLNNGQYQQAINFAKEAVEIDKKRGSPADLGSSLNNIGLIYSGLGQPAIALDYYKQALALAQQSSSLSLQAGILNNIATQRYSIQPLEALADLEKVLQIKRQIRDKQGEALALANIGSVYIELTQYTNAIRSFEQALAISREIKNIARQADILHQIGNYYLGRNDLDKSIASSQQALALRRQLQDRPGELVALNNLARGHAKRGDLASALRTSQAAVQIAEELRTNISSPDIRQSFFQQFSELYEFYIQLLMQLHQQNVSQGYDKQAFEISERSRARTLIELLTEAKANIKEGVDAQLIAEEKNLLNQLRATEDERLKILGSSPSNPEGILSIDKRYSSLQAQYQALQMQIRSKSPRYATLRYPQPLTLPQVQQQLLDPDTLLLQYSLGKDKSVLWVVSRNSLQSHVLPPKKEIESLVKGWRSALLAKPDGPEALDGPASRLGRLLLEPAAIALQSHKRVIVVPDAALHYAPFAALRLGNTPLVASHALVQVPSSSTLALIRSQTAQRPLAPRGLAMVADPIFSSDDPRLTTPARAPQAAPADLASLDLQRASQALPRQRSAGSAASGSLPRLPGTRREAERIMPLFAAQQTLLALDSQASLPLLQSPALAEYRYLHLATHGVFNTAEPALSGVILSLVDQQGRAVNGFLRMNEIFNLNLPSELVVLSACETGLGEQIRGEGMVGLTRGFLYAGSRRLLVSLWKVDDDATAALMSRFYQGLLQDKLSPAQALRAAQNHLRTNSNWDSPYFWSGFVLQGEW